MQPSGALILLALGSLVLAGCGSGPADARTDSGPARTASSGTTRSDDASSDDPRTHDVRPGAPRSADASSATTSAGRPGSMPAPVLPEAARRGDLAGEEAFIEYWFDTFDYAIATGDTGPMMAVADPQCELCEDMRGKITQIYDVGGHVEGGMHTVNYKVAVPPSDVGVASPTVQVTQAQAHEIYPDGRQVANPQTQKNYAMVLTFDDAGWRFFGFGEV